MDPQLQLQATMNDLLYQVAATCIPMLIAFGIAIIAIERFFHSLQRRVNSIRGRFRF